MNDIEGLDSKVLLSFYSSLRFRDLLKFEDISWGLNGLFEKNAPN